MIESLENYCNRVGLEYEYQTLNSMADREWTHCEGCLTIAIVGSSWMCKCESVEDMHNKIKQRRNNETHNE